MSRKSDGRESMKSSKPTEWISWEVICKECNLNKFELFRYIKKGILRPHSEFGIYEPCPMKYHRHRILSERRSYLLNYLRLQGKIKGKTQKNFLSEFEDENNGGKNDKGAEYTEEMAEKEISEIEDKMAEIEQDDEALNSWKYFQEPNEIWEMKELLDEFKNALFRRKEVERFIRDLDLHFETENVEDKLTWMFKLVSNEVEKLYEAIKKNCRPFRNAEIEQIRKAVLEEFSQNVNYFDEIKSYYLEDSDLYILTDRQEKRDFIGRLLKRIADDWALGITNWQALYKEYRKFINKRNR